MGANAIDLKQAGSRLEELVDQAARGEEVILTQRGEPVAKIISITRRIARRQFGTAKGVIHLGEDFDEPLDEFREYM